MINQHSDEVLRGPVINYAEITCARCRGVSGVACTFAKHELDTEWRPYCPDCLDIMANQAWKGNYEELTIEAYYGL